LGDATLLFFLCLWGFVFMLERFINVFTDDGLCGIRLGEPNQTGQYDEIFPNHNHPLVGPRHRGFT